VFKTVTTSVTL